MDRALRRAGGLVVWAVLGVAMLAVVGDLVCGRPEWLDFYPCHRGWPSLVAFVVVGAALPLTLTTGRQRLGGPLVAVAAVAGFTAVAFLPGHVLSVEDDGGRSVWLDLALAAAVVYLLAKMVLFVQQAERAADQRAGVRADLLPSQERILASLVRRIDARARLTAPPGAVIQLEGGWGAGKSFILRRLRCDLEQRRDLAVIHFDSWKHDTELELHRAIVATVLAHPVFLLPYRWLRQPLSLLNPLAIRQLSVEMSSRFGKVAMPVQNVRLPLQRRLEHLVAAAVRAGRHVVIVIDETDRASAETAQAMMTFLKRSLDLPGVTVVLAYVEPILRHKAFNPLTSRLPDLVDNVDAHLLMQLTEAELPGGPVATVVSGTTAEHLPDALHRHLLSRFAMLKAPRRQVIQLGLAEKYLMSEPIVMGSTRDADLESAFAVFSSVRRGLAEITGDKATDDAVRAATRQALIGVRALDPGWTPASLRHIEGAMLRVVTYLEMDDHEADFGDDQIAVVIAVALRLSTLYGSRPVTAESEERP